MTAESFDMTDSIVPRSDQLNAEDLLTGPRTVTITEVRIVGGEQPVEIVTAEFGPGRPFKPSKTVRRILVDAWKADARQYVGHRMTLYRDPSVRFGGQDVGGIRVSHLSHIDKRRTVHLTTTRGKRAPFTVEPLPDEAPKPQTVDLGPMFAHLNDAGLGDKDAALAFISKTIGRTVASSKELTRADTEQVIDALDAMLGPDDQADALPLGVDQ